MYGGNVAQAALQCAVGLGRQCGQTLVTMPSKPHAMHHSAFRIHKPPLIPASQNPMYRCRPAVDCRLEGPIAHFLS